MLFYASLTFTIQYIVNKQYAIPMIRYLKWYGILILYNMLFQPYSISLLYTISIESITVTSSAGCISRSFTNASKEG